MKPTDPNSGRMLFLDLNQVCDQCGKHRAHGSHLKCSRRRQQSYRAKKEGARI